MKNIDINNFCIYFSIGLQVRRYVHFISQPKGESLILNTLLTNRIENRDETFGSKDNLIISMFNVQSD